LLRDSHGQQLTVSQTNKSKHKKSRKRAAGRKGTVDEYDYLIASIGRLVIRVDEKSGKHFRFRVGNETNDSAEALTLLRHLFTASSEHRELAIELQKLVNSMRSDLSTSIVEAWRDRDVILSGVIESGGMGLGGDPSKSLELTRPAINEWKGLGVLLAI
jgi:elongator complex protein 1